MGAGLCFFMSVKNGKQKSIKSWRAFEPALFFQIDPEHPPDGAASKYRGNQRQISER